MDLALKWLFLEALLPLFGATLMYLALGGGRWVTLRRGQQFRWRWREAADSMGWLYGGAILAVQAGIKAGASDIFLQYPGNVAVWVSFAAAGFCAILLTSAMFARGDDPYWKPPSAMIVLTCALMTVIVCAGYIIQESVLKNGVQGVDGKEKQNPHAESSGSEIARVV
jgi:cytochrome bd-type quinol oxidase subunit 2